MVLYANLILFTILAAIGWIMFYVQDNERKPEPSIMIFSLFLGAVGLIGFGGTAFYIFCNSYF